MRRRLLATAAAVLTTTGAVAAVAPAAATAAKPLIGIADNKADMFTDPRFTSLGIRYGRVTVPWDVLADKEQLERLDRWMAGARQTRVRPLLTIDRSPRRPAANPKPADMARLVKGLRARYPGQVKDIATWNEANINKRPKLVAAWWLAIVKACPSCKVLAADLVDRSNAASYARRVAKAAGREPKLWGLHNYVDVNRFKTTGTKKFLQSTAGELWLTETGGVDSRSNTTTVPFSGKGPAHAARALRYLFSNVAALSPRIKRVYVYHWNAPDGVELTWDSAMVGTAAARPSLAVLKDALAGRIKRVRPKKAIPSVKHPVVPRKGKGKGKGKK